MRSGINDDERIEQALDEADEAAAATKARLTAEEVFSRILERAISDAAYASGSYKDISPREIEMFLPAFIFPVCRKNAKSVL